jgi:2-keto-4-pentenoate hydratase/2-oxohepta-3-ene-1,7-dioic acid hydratase in catechol pathway
MRLCRFDAGAGSSLGIVDGDTVLDLTAVQPEMPRDAAIAVAAGIDYLSALASHAPEHPLADVRLLAPARPRKYLAIGLNYADHIAESGMEAPEFPVFFNKQVTCVVGPHDDIHMPRVSQLLDYEGELAIVIGSRCRHVPVDRAHEVVAGYTVANDVSVRDWQVRTPTMTMGKSFDTHGPLGPWLVTPDELGDPHDLTIRTFVNDDLRPDGATREMIYNCFQQIAHLSEAFTLEPGDVIATGTRPASAQRASRSPRACSRSATSCGSWSSGSASLATRSSTSPKATSSPKPTRRRHGRADRAAAGVPGSR